MTGWSIATIGEACTVFSGGTPSKSNEAFWSGDIPWVSAKDLKSDHVFGAELHISQKACDESAAKIAPVGSLLILVRGMGLANGVAIGEVTSPVAFNQDIRAIVPPTTVDSRFLLLALRHSFESGEKDVLSSAAHGTLKIDAEALRQVSFPVPPLPEQRRIVAILDEAFKGIDTAKVNAEKNLLNVRRLFESRVKSYFLSPADGWLTCALGSVCTMYQPKTISGKELVAGGPYSVYGANGVIGRYTTYNHEEAEVLVTCRGATCGAINVSEPRSWVTGNAMVVRPLNGNLDKSFLAYLLRNGVDLSRTITGTAQPQITRTNLSPLMISFPKSISEQLHLTALFQEFQSAAENLYGVYAKKIAALGDLKKSLLHQAFTGQL